MKIDKDITKKYPPQKKKQKQRKLVNKLHRKGYISIEIKRYMLPRNVQPGREKGNPKMHKVACPLSIIVSKKTIPFGLGVRVRRICEEETNHLNERRKLKSRLKRI